jgi:hypothetical protein
MSKRRFDCTTGLSDVALCVLWTVLIVGVASYLLYLTLCPIQ